ncbi:transcription factor HBP-1b(c38)-like protein [Carex littledalei]|uniref:Transcription factor HBP-1b(C38)-like protein n=1 Tax=Carex littledalei TaxID=544730 RepID=A0A833QJD4_9POAL|nr:transcription factor HBP-1b(c38)-like protein [Carex littledalei]
MGALSPQHPAMDALYSQWLLEKQDLLIHLLSVPQDRPDLQIPLIIRMLSHCAEYYNLKSQFAERYIFHILSAYWLTPVERSFLWLGDVKPSTIFQFVPSGLINDQRRMMEQLKRQIVQRQTELEEMMRQVEETMTVLMALAAVHGPVRNGEARGDAERRVAEMMRAVLYEADRLRKHVVIRIIQILSTGQTVQFLVSATNFHLWLRRYGLQSLHLMAHATVINFG